MITEDMCPITDIFHVQHRTVDDLERECKISLAEETDHFVGQAIAAGCSVLHAIQHGTIRDRVTGAAVLGLVQYVQHFFYRLPPLYAGVD